MSKNFEKKGLKALEIFLLFIFTNGLTIPSLMAQNTEESKNFNQDIYLLIEQYNQARENKDTTLLEKILTP